MNIFISYRRNRGGIYADRIHQFFSEYGVKVFYDIEGFRTHAGTFTEKLQKSIMEADDFILLLTEDCFRVEGSSGKIFIQEIETALTAKKRIIPVMIGNFKFTDDLPGSLDVLPELESLELKDMKYLQQFYIDLLLKMTQTPEITHILEDVLWFTKLKTRRVNDKKEPLSKWLSEDVVSVDICAFSCLGLLVNGREYLEDLLERKCRIRIIINDPKSPAAKEAYTMKIASGSPAMRKTIIKQCYDNMCGWMGNFPELFDGRTTKFYLPCAIFIVRCKDPAQNTVKVDYYSFNCPDSSRRSVFIHAQDRDNYRFYENQFEYIWENAQEVDPR